MSGRSYYCWPCQVATVSKAGKQSGVGSGGLQAAPPRGMGPGPEGGLGGQPTPPPSVLVSRLIISVFCSSLSPRLGARWVGDIPQAGPLVKQF